MMQVSCMPDIALLGSTQIGSLCQLSAQVGYADIKCTTLRAVQGIHVSEMSSVEMLFKFIAPLVQQGEDDDDMDEEVSTAA